MIRMQYKYCLMCSSDLKINGKGLYTCTMCDYINYSNPRPTVTALVLNRNRLLLTRRREAPFQGWWDLPGGFIERSEKPEQAIVRELHEETGLRISIKKLFGIYPGTYPSKKESFHVLSIVYIAKGQNIKLKAFDDVSESRWFLKKEIPKKIAFDSNKKIINDFYRQWN